MLNALRLTGGIEQGLFEARTGLPWATIAPKVEQAVAAGDLENQGGLFRATPQGMRYLNDLLVEFLP